MNTPLHIAAGKGDASDVVKLIKQNPNWVRTKCKGSLWTPMMVAARYGHPLCIHQLLKVGKANVHETGKNDITALHLAVAHGHIMCVELLCARWHADPSRCNTFGASSLHFAAQRGQPACLSIMLRFQGREAVGQMDLDGWTPLHIAARGQPRCTKVLVDHGGATAVLRQTKDGSTPAHFACENGDQSSLRTLVMYASKTMWVANHMGYTPLHTAAENGKVACVSVILQQLFKVANGTSRAKDALSLTPKNIKNSSQVRDKLARELTPMISPIRSGQNEAVNLKKKVWTTTHTGLTPLMCAVRNGHYDTIRFFLVQNELPCEITTVDKQGQTVIHHCVQFNQVKCLDELLLHFPASHLDILSNSGDTALHMAARIGCIESIQALTSSGANLVIRSMDGLTALEIAASEGHVECLGELVRGGARVGVPVVAKPDRLLGRRRPSSGDLDSLGSTSLSGDESSSRRCISFNDSESGAPGLAFCDGSESDVEENQHRSEEQTGFRNTVNRRKNRLSEQVEMLLSAVEEGGACKVSDADELQMVQKMIFAEVNKDYGSSAAVQSEILQAYEFDTLADGVFGDGTNAREKTNCIASIGSSESCEAFDEDEREKECGGSNDADAHKYLAGFEFTSS